MRVRFAWLSPLLRLAVAEAESEESDCVGEEGDYHRWPPFLYVADVFDDGCCGCDSGEYWEHSDSPLLRFCCFAREFPGHTAMCKTRAKRKMRILSKNRRAKKQG